MTSAPDAAAAEIERNLGTQPLDAVMATHGLSNHDLTAAATVTLTHKAVQRARKGRRLTAHLQKRVVETLNAALKAKGIDQTYLTAQLFTY